MRVEQNPEAAVDGPIWITADSVLYVNGETARMAWDATVDRDEPNIGDGSTGQPAAEVTIAIALTTTRAE